MTTLYSLSLDGSPILNVSMHVPGFLKRTPKIDPKWLRGVITEQVSDVVKRRLATKSKRLTNRHHGKQVPISV